MNEKLITYQNYLFVVFAFVLPLTTAGVSIIFALIVLLWLIQRDFRTKWKAIHNNNVAMAILLFVGLHIVGLLWTTEPINAHKIYLLLLAPLVMTTLKKEFIPRIMGAFIAAMTISEITSYGKILFSWHELSHLDPTTLTAFVSHITYNPFLAFAISLLIVSLIHKSLDRRLKILLSFFIITMTINMFFTGGRAGQIVLFVMLITLAIYYLRKQKKALIAIICAIPLIYIGLYFVNISFQKRVDLAIDNVRTFEQNRSTSLGLRANFAINSWEIFQEKPLLGHGSGSFENLYNKVNQKNSPTLPTTGNPHNNYLLIMVQFGIVGLFIFLNIFYQQLRFFVQSPPDESRAIRLLLPVMFFVICFSDSYLFGHHTQALFALFTGVLYRNDI